MSRRWAVIVTVAVGLAACGGADDTDVTVSVEPGPTTTIDLADGALIQNEGVTLDADGVQVTSGADAAEEAGAETIPNTRAADAVTDTAAGGDTVATDTGSGGAADNSGGTASADGSTDGSAGGTASDGATTGGTADAGGGTGARSIDPGQGLIVINGVSYPFDIAICEFESDAIEIVGGGVSSDGAGFEADIFYEGADIDDDGTVDSVLEVSVLVDVPLGADGDSVPEFSVFDVTTSSSGSDSVLTFEITGSRISGSGTIEDFNGVAFPADRPGPMTFDASCA